MDEALVKQLKSRVATELRQRELALLEYWLEEVKKIEAKRHQDLAALLNDLKGLITRMQNRLQTLKSGRER
ncbi:MAG: hypothetical protein JRI57_07265 [Deltaproteobacteria bacterium]|nr:hypothetical protein [Deltaproteobacteria bacterium]MBW1952618.1 hypothetical protein [Deltaproteobacteria bacterium]MBW1986255.1 hypothetical protein [Deltaproteobacteria bacterium]MBW2134152.1 hypothetical protein [Deltaproteobacteria bacterium]